jgi:hypothetical protein
MRDGSDGRNASLSSEEQTLSPRRIKIITAALLSAAFILIWRSAAKPRQFGLFEADVPRGWSVRETERQAVFMAPGGSASVTVMAEKTEGSSLKEIAGQMSRNLAGSAPRAARDGFKFIFRNLDGIECEASVKGGRTGFYLVVIKEGWHPQIKKLAGSISFAD